MFDAGSPFSKRRGFATLRHFRVVAGVEMCVLGDSILTFAFTSSFLMTAVPLIRVAHAIAQRTTEGCVSGPSAAAAGVISMIELMDRLFCRRFLLIFSFFFFCSFPLSTYSLSLSTNLSLFRFQTVAEIRCTCMDSCGSHGRRGERFEYCVTHFFFRLGCSETE